MRRGGDRPLITPLDVAWVLLIVTAGALIGTITGLLPGLHVNTVAPMVLAATLVMPALTPAISGGTAAALLLFAVALVHTIINVIPTLAAPIPDGDEALVLLPIQRMASLGQATDALRISVRASWLGGAVAALFALGVLFLYPVGAPKIPQRAAVTAVMGILVMMILRHSRPGRSLALLLLVGMAGWVLLPVTLVGPFGGDGTILLPAFAGLFGTPLLVMALLDEPVPDAVGEGASEGPPTASRVAPWIGSGCGLLVALFPGLTSATAGAVGRAVRQPASDADDVAMLSAIDTANVVGNTAALLVWGATRSGASAAARVAQPELSLAGAGLLAAFVMTILLTSTWIASVGALRYGPGLVVRLRSVDPQRLALFGLALLGTIVVLHSGPLGLVVTVALLPLGLLPHRWQVPRALLMGFLLVPYLGSFIGRPL